MRITNKSTYPIIIANELSLNEEKIELIRKLQQKGYHFMIQKPIQKTLLIYRQLIYRQLISKKYISEKRQKKRKISIITLKKGYFSLNRKKYMIQ